MEDAIEYYIVDEFNGGSDGARTRNPQRDRLVL